MMRAATSSTDPTSSASSIRRIDAKALISTGTVDPFGFISYTAIKVLRGKFRQVNWLVYVLTALFTFRFLYLANG